MVSFAKAALPVEAIALTNAVASLPDPQTMKAPAARLSMSAAKWRAACTACFGEIGSATGQQRTGAEIVPVGRANAFWGSNSTAALAGLVLALGGYRRTEPEGKRGWNT
jgi:hypothetical protein